jgi:hypothetical protein
MGPRSAVESGWHMFFNRQMSEALFTALLKEQIGLVAAKLR